MWNYQFLKQIRKTKRNYFKRSHIWNTLSTYKAVVQWNWDRPNSWKNPSMSLTLRAVWHRNAQMTTAPSRNSSRSLYHHKSHMLSIIKPSIILFFKIIVLSSSRPELQMPEGWICRKLFLYNVRCFQTQEHKGCFVLTLQNCSCSPLFGEGLKLKIPLSYRTLIHTPHRCQGIEAYIETALLRLHKQH